MSKIGEINRFLEDELDSAIGTAVVNRLKDKFADRFKRDIADRSRIRDVIGFNTEEEFNKIDEEIERSTNRVPVRRRIRQNVRERIVSKIRDTISERREELLDELFPDRDHIERLIDFIYDFDRRKLIRIRHNGFIWFGAFLVPGITQSIRAVNKMDDPFKTVQAERIADEDRDAIKDALPISPDVLAANDLPFGYQNWEFEAKVIMPYGSVSTAYDKLNAMIKFYQVPSGGGSGGQLFGIYPRGGRFPDSRIANHKIFNRLINACTIRRVKITGVTAEDGSQNDGVTLTINMTSDISSSAPRASNFIFRPVRFIRNSIIGQREEFESFQPITKLISP